MPSRPFTKREERHLLEGGHIMVRMPNWMKDTLGQLARVDGRKLSAYVRKVLQDHLQSLSTRI